MASSKQDRAQREARDRLQRYQARQQVHAHQNKRRLRDNLFAIAGVLVVAALAATTQIFYFTAGPGAPTPEPSASRVGPAHRHQCRRPRPVDRREPRVDGQLTINDVMLGIQLDGVNAPQASPASCRLPPSGYYPGKTCHRLATSDGFGFMQCGSLDGTGASDPGFAFGPIENAPADGIYQAGHHRDGPHAGQRLQQRAPVLHRHRAPRSAPTPPAGTPSSAR